MVRLEEIRRGVILRGVIPDESVEIVDVTQHGNDVVEITYKRPNGDVGSNLLYRHQEHSLTIESPSFSFDVYSDADEFKLAAEALRIKYAYLFDPLFAVNASAVEPLPHQISAVYDIMLSRSPLRFLLADDPGAGKTIMAGLYIKELFIRGELERCLVCCPGNLAEQWQDELWEKFALRFDILTREMAATSPTGNPFQEHDFLICRLDQLSRNEELQAKLEATTWDLIIVDEAHKMSAHLYGQKVKETKRYKLGSLMSRITRHFLLLTATPHSGKQDDFGLFMKLLDEDRFERRHGKHATRPSFSDMMRKLMKEELVTFDGKKLFPERFAYTVTYRLSDEEARLYEMVTEYVRDQMNRADRFDELGDRKRKNTVGFALTILQRRLASSPEAIYQSLKRRRERLEKRLKEERSVMTNIVRARGEPQLDELELDVSSLEELEEELPGSELESIEDEVAASATASRTIEELEAEIETLRDLEEYALRVRNSGKDRKWEQLCELLQTESLMFDENKARNKLIIFSEHKDTVMYLANRVRTLLGKPEAVLTITGSTSRDERRLIQESFMHDPRTAVLIATDAAGEGINLHRAHLMINYDLPWNPNRIEQRFGRIHRIGQTRVCHLWNLVAHGTREGSVYARLLEKIELAREQLGGQVFDVLGDLFVERPLRDLLLEAILYGERREVQERLFETVDTTVDIEHIRSLLERRALAYDHLDTSLIAQLKDALGQAHARRLQPYYIASFFEQALKVLGGSCRKREEGRYEVTHVPIELQRFAKKHYGGRKALPRRYERITFEKDRIVEPGKPLAEFISPGHPLLDSLVEVVLQRFRSALERGLVLIDPNDFGSSLRCLYIVEHAVRDGRTDASGRPQIVSRLLSFIEVNEEGNAREIEYASYLDYISLKPGDEHIRSRIESLLANRTPTDLREVAVRYAITTIAEGHLKSIQRARIPYLDRVWDAVYRSLTGAIAYWDQRAEELKQQEREGKKLKMNWQRAQERAAELHHRLKQREREIEQQRQLFSLPPAIIGTALVVPWGLLAEEEPGLETDPETERAAIEAVLKIERELGRVPTEMPPGNPGFDILSRTPDGTQTLFIEVKGRREGARTITLTANELRTCLNVPDRWVLALVTIRNETPPVVRYLRPHAFGPKEPGFAVTHIAYDFSKLFKRGEEPS